MSRSHRAWTENCASVRAVVGGAGKLGKPEVQPRLGHERLLLGTASAFARLRWLAAAVALVLACGPAVALGRASVSGRSQPPATHPHSSLQAHAVTRSAAGSPDRSRAGGRSLGGSTVSAQLLVPGAGERRPGGSGPVRALQRRLAGLGFAPGPVDGRYGPRTEQAVTRLQAAHGLRVDGIAGPQTLATLATSLLVLYPGAGYEPGGSGTVRVLQRRLAGLGFAPGPVDGRYGPRTEQAVRRFQADHGLQVDGIADPSTVARLGAQIGSQQRSSRRSRPLPVSPARTRKPAGAPVPKAVVGQTSRSAGVPSLAWLLLAAALVLGLLAIVARRGTRRRGVGIWVRSPQPQASVREQAAPVNGAEQPDPAAQEGHVVVTQGAAAPGEPAGVQAGSQLATEQSDADGAFNLGMLLERQGDMGGALAAYRRADECGHGPAACNLGVLLEEHDDATGAIAAYRRAAQRGDANGAFNLGVLLEGQGDMTGALGAYRRADECGHGPAACNLGVLLEQQDDATGALAAYRRAAQRGDANGAFNLGALLEEHGDPVGAVAAYDRARQHESTQETQVAGAGDEAPALAAAGNAGDEHRV